MGACGSKVAAVTTVTAAEWTAKVILPDGRILEFSSPVRAAVALEKHAGDFFLCDADEMEFNGYVSAVEAEEGLCQGQLYFVLPKSMLQRPLRAADLAALAVKASAAMGETGVLVFTDKAKRRRTPPARRCGGGLRFLSELSIISE